MTIVRRPALHPVVVAVVDALSADVNVQSYLHERPVEAVQRVFAVGAVPPEFVGRWIEVGNPGEGWDVRFMRGGSRISLLVHLWHSPVEGDDISQAVVDLLWAFVAPALSVPLALSAPHAMLAGVATLIDVGRDADNRSWHGIVRYEAKTRDTT